MSIAPICTAVIGYGLSGRVFHCPFLAAVPGLKLAVIVQRHGDEAALAWPGVAIARDAEEVFNDPRIELVTIATPNATHFPLAMRALAAGKHVVVDKPFTATSADALRLLEAARQAGKLAVPFHNRRFDGDFLTVRQLLASRRLGRVVRVDSALDRFRPLQRPNTWKESDSGLSGTNGLLFDLGPHLVDQALALFGPPRTITANVGMNRDETAIEDSFDVALEYGDREADGQGTSTTERSLRFTCRATLLAADPNPRFSVYGTRGSYRKWGVDPQESALRGGARPPMLGSPAPWLPEPEAAWGTLTEATRLAEPVALTTNPLPTVAGDYRLFYAGVRDAIRGSGPLPVSGEEGYRGVRLLELARQSSVEGRTLPVVFSKLLSPTPAG